MKKWLLGLLLCAAVAVPPGPAGAETTPFSADVDLICFVDYVLHQGNVPQAEWDNIINQGPWIRVPIQWFGPDIWSATPPDGVEGYTWQCLDKPGVFRHLTALPNGSDELVMFNDVKVWDGQRVRVRGRGQGWIRPGGTGPRYYVVAGAPGSPGYASSTFVDIDKEKLYSNSWSPSYVVAPWQDNWTRALGVTEWWHGPYAARSYDGAFDGDFFGQGWNIIPPHNGFPFGDREDLYREYQCVLQETNYGDAFHINGQQATNGVVLLSIQVHVYVFNEEEDPFAGNPTPKDPRDLDEDGALTPIDLAKILENFGMSPGKWREGDVDDDGTVGFSDFLQLEPYWAWPY